MDRHDHRRAAARRVLWSHREDLLPHCLEHRGCGVWGAVLDMCADAKWTPESYLLAAFFDREDLIVEVTK